MRAIATGLLVAMTAVYLATRLAPASWLWAGYVGAFAEASMVGACADWFAVTALFRRPLGLPIPHTAIIPRNKARIGQALGDFIGGEFLTPRVLDRKLRELGPARRLADWLRDAGAVEALSARIADMLPDITPSSPALRGFIGEVARRAARAGPAAPLAAKLLGYLWSDAGAQRLLDRAIDRLGAYLIGHSEFIQARVAGNSWRWMPKWIDRLLAEKLTAGLLRAVGEMRDPAHPWRLEMREAMDRFIARLADDPDFLARGEALKDSLLGDPRLRTHLEAVWAELEERLGVDPSGMAEIIAQALARALTALGEWLDADLSARERLDGWVRVAARRTLSPRRKEIGAFVAQVVAGWDAREVVEKLELHVGKDLQYIRINGALVGGLVGLLIYTASRLIH